MICLLGGTFDPVHCGHLQAALAAGRRLACEVRMVLAPLPPHRPPPAASAEHRWKMLEIACADCRMLAPDPRELRRSEPSYTVETLALARRLAPREPIFWALGSDAFREIGAWHRWQTMLKLCHLLLLERPGAALDAPAQALYRRFRLNAVPAAPCGGILRLQADLPDISASQIRAAIAAGGLAGHLLPAGVSAYIIRHGLYASRSDQRQPRRREQRIDG